MTKVAIKNENITSFGGIYHIMDVFSKLGFENLPNLYWVNVDAAARHSTMEAFQALSSSAAFVVKIVLRTSMRLQDSSGRDLVRCYPVPTPWGADWRSLPKRILSTGAKPPAGLTVSIPQRSCTPYFYGWYGEWAYKGFFRYMRGCFSYSFNWKELKLCIK